jgi:mannosyl-oligosaccharide alpha-1,2-mannosidase
LPSSKSSFTGGAKFELPTSALDFPSVTISAWIYLEKGLGENDLQIKTILANRASGCVKDAEHSGYALYINEWNTADLSVNLMWHNGKDPCIKLKTSSQSIKYSTWHHIGAILEHDMDGQAVVAKIFVDGEMKASTTSDEPRILAKSNNKFIIGSHTAGGENFPFYGKIAHVAVAEGASESLAGSYPDFFVAGDARVKAYWEDFAGEKPKDASGNGIALTKVKLGYDYGSQANAVAGSQIPFLVPLGSDEDMASGTWPRDSFYLTKDMKEKSDALARERRQVVKNAMTHAWTGYDSKAFGSDEVTPKSGQPRNTWGGMAVTLVDSLDTLWIMGMKDEFYKARDYCRDQLRFDRVGSVSTFETTIRVLGGLMSAYDLSHDNAFLDRARELGDRLSAAFQTSSGLPVPSVSLNSGTKGNAGNVVIAEVGTLQLEFRSLAYNTKDPKYARMVEKVHQQMRRSPPADGLWPIYVNVQSGMSAGGAVTFGALGDSFFEYLLKIWVQGGKTEPEYLADYERAMDGVHRLVLQRSSPGNLAYLGDYTPGGGIRHKMDHLACFVPGMLALGVRKRGESTEFEQKNKRDMTVAKALAYTCVQMYERQPTGISPEYVNWQAGKDFTVPGDAPFYILRPETVESLYILHTMTGHPVYRDWGHRIMMNIEKHCKLPFGYGALPDVRSTSRQPDDRMESFFLAETLKYLYLLQDPDSEINLDEWVFNTEAHPLRVFPPGWREKLGI